ncbi:MAG: caspase family protein [Myxococcota bacterium]|nr:caspase family protein [Myxococcota bacterium]
MCFLSLYAGTASATELRILVAVGVSEGLPSETDLEYAENDAERIAHVMTHFGRFKEDRVIRVLGGTASDVKAALDTAHRWAKEATDADTTFIFYYSGHADTNDLHISGRRLARAELENRIQDIPAAVRVSVFDACRTRGELAQKGLRRKKGFAINVSQAPAMQGTVSIQSSSENEASQESKALRGAVFTHYLLTGLRGAADRDRDGQVSLDEVYIYAFRQTVKRSAAGPGNVMHPSVDLDLKGAGALILTNPRKQSARLVLPKGRDQQYLVYQKASGALVAEVWAEPRRTLHLAVSPGRYLIQQRTGHSGGAQIVDVEANAVVKVAQGAFTPFPLSILKTKGAALELFQHQLRLGYASGLTSDVAYAHQVSLRYGYGARDWTVSLGVEYGRSEWETTSFNRQEQWLQVDLRGDWPRLMGPVDLGFGLAWRYSFQQRKERRSTDGSAYAPQTNYSEGSGLGPVLMLGYRLDLTATIYMYFDAAAYGMVRQENEAFVFRPDGRVGIRLGFEW